MSQRYVVSSILPGQDGSYDYASVDPDTGDLFIGREFGVQKIALTSGASETVLERADVAAVLMIPGTRLMLSTNGSSNSATLFDRDNGHVLGDFPTGEAPDGAFYDAASGLAFVMNSDGGDATVIDIAGRRVAGTIKLGEAPEAGVSDGAGHAFINLEAGNEIAVVDIASLKLVTRYALPGCIEPTGLAYDTKSGLLISACHNGTAKLIDAGTGTDRGSISIGKGADGSIFDPHTRRGFVPSIDGVLISYRMDEHGNVSEVSVTKTREGARTAAYDPVSYKLYLPAAHVEWGKAGEYLGARRGFSVIVVSPGK
ncbi:MAG: YncE family protein [Novosphingobium sp.]